MDFDTYLTQRTDKIYEAAFELLKAVALPTVKLEYSMELVAPVVEYAEHALNDANVLTCYPFHEGAEALPCTCGVDCWHKSCLHEREE